MKVTIPLVIATLAFAVSVTSEVTDEDINSPLVSYLLAKIQRLESKVMSKPRTSQISKRSSEKATNCECPPLATSYTRWGNSSCPFGASTLYKGVAVGGDKDTNGSPANMMCLPPNPMRYTNGATGIEYVYGVEYQTTGTLDHADARNMPCAVCEVPGKTTTLMIPSHYMCPFGWHFEYNGYIMVGDDGEEGSSVFDCIDFSLEQVPGTGGDRGWHYKYPVRVSTSSDSLPYDSSYAMSCVVCSKWYISLTLYLHNSCNTLGNSVICPHI